MSRTAKEIILATLALAIMLVGCANDTDAPARAVVSETTAAGAVVTETTTTKVTVNVIILLSKC